MSTMNAEPPSDPGRTLRELEEEKLREEIRQLRAAGKTKWITPAALATLLPLVAGLGLWIVAEVKQYGEGYRAIAERDELAREKRELQEQKDSLYLEVSTLLQLKAHYAEQAKQLQEATESKQQAIDQTYLRGIFTRAEAMYSLDHIKGMGPSPDLASIKRETAELPPETKDRIEDVLDRYEFCLTVIDMSHQIIDEFDEATKLMPTSDWVKDLTPAPTGAEIPGRKIMVSQRGDVRRLYDVSEGRFLTAAEVESASR